MTDGTKRADIIAGLKVSIVLKQDQRTGKLTEGIVLDILTKSATTSSRDQGSLEKRPCGQGQNHSRLTSKMNGGEPMIYHFETQGFLALYN